jgi:hypothetical protein
MHHLLTVLGTQPRRARYSLNGRQAEAALAPLALLELLSHHPERCPSHVLALCTPAAKEESWPLLVKGLGPRFEARAVELPGDPADVRGFLRAVAQAVEPQPGTALTVDATHGFRHHSFLTCLAALYLAELRGTEVRGAWYGLLQEAESRFLDLRPLLELPRWIHALRTFSETGSARPLAALLEGPSRPMARALRELSLAHGTGLPLELGRLSADFLRQHARALQKALAAEHALPLAEELTGLLTARLEDFRLPQAGSGEGWKRQVELSREELRRQARLVEDLLERGSLAAALGLMREWTVSWAVLSLGLQGDWLDHGRVRRRAESVLGALAALHREPVPGGMEEEQRGLARFWASLTELRNAFQHAGMRPRALAGPRAQLREKLEAVREYWDQTLRHCPALALQPAPALERPLLVSALGLRPGVLFSALRACAEREGPPGACLVICSRETEDSVARAVEQAGFQGPVERLVLEDPFGGRGEIQRLARAARAHLLQAEEVWVNLTGGTTLMGLVVEAVAEEAGRLARTVRRFGLVDRRPAAEQEAEPFRQGEALWFDAEGAAHGGAD